MSECACGAPATANGRECAGCFRSRISTVGHAKSSPADNRRWDGRLERYAATRAEGSLPMATTDRAIDTARAASDETGRAFRADMFGGA